MRTAADRQTILLCVLLVALLAAAGWAWSAMAASRQAAAVAADGATVAASRASVIAASRVRPTLAAAGQTNLELATQVQRAAAAADLPPGAVGSIGTEQQSRLGPDTSERLRQISLRGVALPQVASFARALLASAGDLRVKSLRLSVPNGGAADEFWNAEVVVAYTVYDPAGDLNR